MATAERDGEPMPSRKARVGRVIVSIVILTWITVIVGYGGGLVLTITATLFGYDPETDDGDRLRDRLLDWPDRNRDVMRTNGSEPVPWKP